MNRRQFNRAALVAGGGALLGATASRPAVPFPVPHLLPPLPEPNASGIDHIVVVTMENRSFDHFFGWMPNVNGRQAGLTYVDTHGVAHPTHSLSGGYTVCSGVSPDHSYAGARIEYNGGKMNGFLLDTANDAFSIGYYGAQDIPFYASLAQNYTTCSRYFASILGPTFPNRMFLHAAQSDRLTDSVNISSLPTIWDRLAEARVSHTYYFSNVPYLALWGTRYVGMTKTYDQFKDDAAHGTLPAVSFVDPRYTVLDDGTGNDDHPHADIREGDRFLYDVFQAVSHVPGWARTVLVINFDEWGGFFEHVPPPPAQAANGVDTDIVGGKTLLGMRVPVVVASPFSAGSPAQPVISSLTYDHTSVLKLIEWRWGLTPLTPRDASSDIMNLAHALEFSRPQFAVPALPKPHTPFFVLPCFGGVLGGLEVPAEPGGRVDPAATQRKTNAIWSDLREMARQSGFPVA